MEQIILMGKHLHHLQESFQPLLLAGYYAKFDKQQSGRKGVHWN